MNNSKTSRVQGKLWALTINNFDDKDLEIMNNIPNAQYCAFQQEISNTNTPHIQGVVYFRQNMSISGIKKILPKAHIELCKGSLEQNIKYCSKSETSIENTFVEYGIKPKTQHDIGQNEVNRWDNARENALNGNFEQIPSDIFIRNYNTIKSINRDNRPIPATLSIIDCYWYYGPSGSGKSSSARRNYPAYYLKDPNSKWWDGYNYESVVLLDDLDHSHAKYSAYYKVWCDHYAFNAELKGSSMRIRPSTFVVTSQYRIDEIWNDQATIDALTRRFKTISFSL